MPPPMWRRETADSRQGRREPAKQRLLVDVFRMPLHGDEPRRRRVGGLGTLDQAILRPGTRPQPGRQRPDRLVVPTVHDVARPPEGPVQPRAGFDPQAVAGIGSLMLGGAGMFVGEMLVQ